MMYVLCFHRERILIGRGAPYRHRGNIGNRWSRRVVCIQVGQTHVYPLNY